MIHPTATPSATRGRQVHARYPIDRSRTLVLGFCEGAMMGLRLASHAFGSIEDAGKVAALAMVAGTAPQAVSGLPSGLRIYWVHGRQDAVHNCYRAGRDAARMDEVDGVSAEFREVCACVYLRVPACACMCLRVCVRLCAPVHVCVSVHARAIPLNLLFRRVMSSAAARWSTSTRLSSGMMSRSGDRSAL